MTCERWPCASLNTTTWSTCHGRCRSWLGVARPRSAVIPARSCVTRARASTTRRPAAWPDRSDGCVPPRRYRCGSDRRPTRRRLLVPRSSPRPAIAPRRRRSGRPWLCIAKRGSRCRSAPFRAFGIDPKVRSPFSKLASIPEIRGDPSARKVAIVLWRWASNNARICCANSGAVCSTSRHVAIRSRCHTPIATGGSPAVHLRTPSERAPARTSRHTSPRRRRADPRRPCP